MMRALEWIGADMSASTRTKWVQLPSGWNRLCIGIGWPATDSPTGTLAIEVSDHGTEGTAGAVYPVTILTQPAGSAATLLLDNIQTAAQYIAMTYTRTSGGTGAVFTDDSGVAGKTPKITIKG